MARRRRFEMDFHPERRGFGKKRGVPDEVIWIQAALGSSRYRFPLLVELEGNLPNAIVDFSEFSKRAIPNRDFVRIHVIGRSRENTRLPLLTNLRFNILETSYGSSGLHAQGDEGDLFRSICEWCEMQRRSVVLPLRSRTETQKWTLEWFGLRISIFGLLLNVRVPVLRLKEQTTWVKPLLPHLRLMEIPCVVVSKLCSWGRRNGDWPMPILLRGTFGFVAES